MESEIQGSETHRLTEQRRQALPTGGLAQEPAPSPARHRRQACHLHCWMHLDKCHTCQRNRAWILQLLSSKSSFPCLYINSLPKISGEVLASWWHKSHSSLHPSWWSACPSHPPTQQHPPRHTGHTLESGTIHLSFPGSWNRAGSSTW